MVLGIFCFLHCLFFVVALAITGFTQMMTSLFFATMSYSVYLTLREWSIIMYIILLVFLSFTTVMDRFQNSQYYKLNDNQLAPLGFFLQVGMQGMAAYFISRSYYFFRKTGGIHGLRGVNELMEDRLMGKAKDLA